MKVLLFDTINAFFTPGGRTTHALKLQQELSKLGVNIEFSRWWDENQSDCDIVHFLVPDIFQAKLAKERGKKMILTLVFDFESNKSLTEQLKTRWKNKIIDVIPFVQNKAYWHSFPYFDKIVFMHQYDKETALRYFPRFLNAGQTMIIPHAYDPGDMYISKHPDIAHQMFPQKYLISCAHISPRKQSIILAQYAKKAQTPIVFMGGPGESKKYFDAFRNEVDNRYVFYPGFVSKEQKDYIEQQASGFVLLSQGESGCISVYEAAAYKLPLLLSDLPWARGYDTPAHISYCNYKNPGKAVTQLKNFYDRTEKLQHPPFKIHTWSEIAQIYSEQYKKLVK